MKNVSRFVSVWLGGAVVVAVACGGSTNSNSGNDAGNSSSSGGGSSSSGGTGSSSGSMNMDSGPMIPACLMSGCPMGMSCCITGGVGTCMASCPDGGITVGCTSADSCATGEVCCASLGMGLPSLTCEASCPAGNYQLCDMTHPCPTGESCISMPPIPLTFCAAMGASEGGMPTEGGPPPDSSVPVDSGSDSPSGD
jgi:hypothetical protein